MDAWEEFETFILHSLLYIPFHSASLTSLPYENYNMFTSVWLGQNKTCDAQN